MFGLLALVVSYVETGAPSGSGIKADRVENALLISTVRIINSTEPTTCGVVARWATAALTRTLHVPKHLKHNNTAFSTNNDMKKQLLNAQQQQYPWLSHTLPAPPSSKADKKKTKPRPFELM